MPSLLRDPQFRDFWSAGVVSQLGSGVGGIALPLTAVGLGASAMDMGILTAASQVPVLFLALHAGVWVDRIPRRPIMVVTNVGRGIALTLVPVASIAGLLQIPLLWAVALMGGVLGVVYDLAVTSYPPTLVPRDRLADANATLTAGGNGAAIVGRAAGGWIVRLLGAPLAILVDAASFVAAGLMMARLRAPETMERPERRSMAAEIAEGFATVWHDPVLRAMIVATTVGSFAGSITGTVFVLFAVRVVGLSAPAIGIALSLGAGAGLIAALVAGRLTARFGSGGAMVWGSVGMVVSALVLIVAPAGTVGSVLVAVAQVLASGGLTIFSINQISLRQAITPPHVLGRVNAVRRVTVFGVIPIGALLAGFVGDAVGLRFALAVAAVFQVAALVLILASPLRTARDVAPA